MKIIKFILKIITEPFNTLMSKSALEGLVKFNKKNPVVTFIISAIITAIIVFLYYY